MRRIVVNYTSANSGQVIPLNYDNIAIGIGFVCEVTGTVNYTVNHTYDDIYNAAITPVWLPHGVANMVGATTTQESNFVIPVAAMQVVINSGTGSVNLVALQQGII